MALVRIDGTANGGADQRRQYDRRGQLVAQRLPDDRLQQQLLQQHRGQQRRGESCAGGGLPDVQLCPIWCGQQVGLCVPVPDGTYTIRLHFAEPSYTSINQRKFDVQLNGSVVQSGYDVYAAAGAQYKATALSFDVTASGGSGILLELVNLTAAGAILSGIELTSANVGGVPAPTVNLDVSTDNGSSWTPVATDLALDASGQGSYAWTAGPETAGNTALVRVRPTTGTQPQDTSDQGFLIANAGTDYYVAVTGDNAQSGKSPDQPMASLSALLAAYHLTTGDMIKVDTGTYNLSTNVVITADDSGVTIQGPSTGGAILNRGDTGTSKYAVELNNADNVTLEHLALTGRLCRHLCRERFGPPARHASAGSTAMPSTGSTPTAPATMHS